MAKRKYPKPRSRNVSKEAVLEIFKEIGFQHKQIEQQWRHLTAFGKYKGKHAVFKMASTKETAKRTKNEYLWNKAVNSVSARHRKHFCVPENYLQGERKGLFSFVAQYFLGDNLREKYENGINISKYLKQIASAVYELENIPISETSEFAMAKKSKRQKTSNMGRQILESSSEWASQVPLDLSRFLAIIDKQKDNIKTCVGHGDFVLKYIYLMKDKKIGIIDGEHAGYKGPLYYDVAQFYIRLRNDHGETKTAGEFLKEFKNILPQRDKKAFWQNLKPILIQRYIGDLWGASKDTKKLNSLKKLGEEILRDEII